MFNKIENNYSSKEYVPYEKKVTITENRAATDKSIELLNEFQEKAKENLICSISLKDNIFNVDIKCKRYGHI